MTKKIELPFPAIALCGPKGAGKSWIINEVTRNVETALKILNKERSRPIRVLNFADPIYIIQAVIVGGADGASLQRAREFNESIKEIGLDNHVEPLINMSPRSFRQKFGTEFMRREAGDDVWIKLLRQKYNRYVVDEDHSGFIVSDIRFPNELEFLKKEGFTIFYINTMNVDVGDHPSEKYTIDLADQCDELVKSEEDADRIVDIISNLFVTYISDNIEILT